MPLAGVLRPLGEYARSTNHSRFFFLGLSPGKRQREKKNGKKRRVPLTYNPPRSIFLGLQIPSMCLAPFIGWLRDRIGLRWPTTIGWVLTAPLLWFSGVPGDSDFLGIGADRRGQGVFVATIIAIGICSSLVRGAGTFQLTCELLLIDIDLSFLLFFFLFFISQIDRFKGKTKQSLSTNRLFFISARHSYPSSTPRTRSRHLWTGRRCFENVFVDRDFVQCGSDAGSAGVRLDFRCFWLLLYGLRLRYV